MPRDPDKRRAANRRYYETHKAKCRESSRNWKREKYKDKQARKASETTWKARRRAILARRDPQTHRYDNREGRK